MHVTVDVKDPPPTLDLSTDKRLRKVRSALGPGLQAARKESMSIGDIAVLRSHVHGFKAKYDLGKRLAAGAQGVTYLATEKESDRQVVVKQPKNTSDTGDYELLKDKHHPNIVRVYELFHNSLATYVVMECCPGGDLFGALEGLVESGALTQNWCAAMFKQACEGVNYLHTQFKCSHNDLKPENILLSHTPEGASDVPRVMVADFGCVKSIGQAASGDPRYEDPLCTRGYPKGSWSDVWSLGVTLFELVSGGMMPWVYRRNVKGFEAFMFAEGGRHPNQYGRLYMEFEQSRRGMVPIDATRCVSGQLAQDLVGKMLTLDPQARISIPDILEHPWMELIGSDEEVALEAEAMEALAARTKGNRLNVGLLNLVGAMLEGDALEFYRGIWSKYETSGDGLLAQSEFEEMLTDGDLNSGGPGGLCEKVEDAPPAADIFQLADVDGSGHVSFDEFVGMMFDPDQLTDEDKLTYIKSAFGVLAGEDGSVSAQEFSDFFKGQDSDDFVNDLFAVIELTEYSVNIS